MVSDDDRDDISIPSRVLPAREAAAAAAEMETLGLRTPLANDPARGGTPVSTAARAGASPARARARLARMAFAR